VTGTGAPRRTLSEWPGRSWPRWRAAAVAAATAGIALLAACGGGPGGSGGSAASSSGPATYQQTLAYSQCMRSHGDPGFPYPQQGPGGAWAYPETPQDQSALSGPGFAAAQKACRKLQPPTGLSPAQRQAATNQALALSRCMRAHGITNFPDPTSNGQGIGINLGSAGIDPNSPQYRTAQQACHLPGAPSGGGK
jgi:hypothetical protein